MSEHGDDAARSDDNRRFNEDRSVEIHFYREQTAELVQLVTGMGLRLEEAESVVQKVWLRFFQDQPSFEGDDAAERRQRWLHTVAPNETFDVFRWVRRHPPHALDALRNEPVDRRGEETAIQEIMERERELLHTWMEELREEKPCDYRLLYGHFFENRSIKILAAEEGISENAVSCRLYATKRQLRRRAKEMPDDETTSR